jgi:small subunit ribosomal protein S3
MGQKNNPHGLRVGPTLIKKWDSIFYAEKNYKKLFLEDIQTKNLINKNYTFAQVSRILIDRPSVKSIVVNIYARKPGVIIGKSGNDIDKLKKDVQKIVALDEIYINIHEVKRPNVDAPIIAQNVALQLEKRASFRKVMKTAMQSCLKHGGQGIKISCSGRLAGAEIARTEWYMEGRVPLHTLRADIDYATAEAMTTYGVIGVKVWVYNGEYSESRRKN